MLTFTAAAPHAAAIAALAGLLAKAKVDGAFVGRVAVAAWTGDEVAGGAIDALAITSPERSGHLPMMAANNGFGVDREAVEAAAELDLIPMSFPATGHSVRVHILMATNALYGRMVRDAVEAKLDGAPLRVVTAEDLALLLTMADEPDLRERVINSAGAFDLARFNRSLVAIGLGGKVISA